MAIGNNSTSFGGTSIPVSVLGQKVKDTIAASISFLGENIRCTTATYTQDDLNTLQAEISNIVISSQLLESKKLYHKSLIAQTALNNVNCIGTDLFYIYNPLVDRLKSFVKYYYAVSSSQETQLSIDSNSELNPDYFNS